MEMNVHAGKTFTDQNMIDMDWQRFIDCTFDGSIISYAGQGPVGIERCKFIKPRFEFTGAAGNTVYYLRGFRLLDPSWAERIREHTAVASLEMVRHVGETFANEDIEMDAKHFVECNFQQCTIHYAGVGPMVMERCNFNEIHFAFIGAAKNTINYLRDFTLLVPYLMDRSGVIELGRSGEPS